jgi:hypothetical protein
MWLICSQPPPLAKKMKPRRKAISQRVHIASTIFLVFVAAASSAQHSSGMSSTAVVLEVRHGFTEQGSITPEWKEAIRDRHSEESLNAVAQKARVMSADESKWSSLIEQRMQSWREMIDSLRLPFVDISPPDTVTILLGNQGGNDAFSPSPSTICFDLSQLYSEYGGALSDMNRKRIDKFFAHEFTHVLHKAWAMKHSLQLQTPLDIALWECLKEGLGNYRSLSDRWVSPTGEPTDHALDVLRRLQPIFVERLSALRRASDKEAPRLLEGLSMGPFDQKWGALTVALWLAQEAKGNDGNLQKWVETGPSGVLELARMYLPDEMKKGLPNVNNSSSEGAQKK